MQLICLEVWQGLRAENIQTSPHLQTLWTCGRTRKNSHISSSPQKGPQVDFLQTSRKYAPSSAAD